MRVRHIPAKFPPLAGAQKQIPAFAEVFCKQLAVVCVFSEAGGFDFQDPVQIALLYPADRISLATFCYPLFWTTWRLQETVGVKKAQETIGGY